MDFLRLLGGRDLAGSDSPDAVSVHWMLRRVDGGLPDGLVGDHHLGPLLLGELGGGGVELAGDDLDGLVGFPFLRASVWAWHYTYKLRAGYIYLEGLANAENHTQPTINSSLDLGRSELNVTCQRISIYL